MLWTCTFFTTKTDMQLFWQVLQSKYINKIKRILLCLQYCSSASKQFLHWYTRYNELSLWYLARNETVFFFKISLHDLKIYLNKTKTNKNSTMYINGLSWNSPVSSSFQLVCLCTVKFLFVCFSIHGYTNCTAFVLILSLLLNQHYTAWLHESGGPSSKAIGW